jgi:uncharacterized RDD family membrane protein YckC
MTQSPAGWYPEPDPAYAGQPGRLRYWDGQRWTEHVHEPEPPQPTPPAYPVAPPPPTYPVAPQPPAYPAAPQPTAYPSYGAYQQPYGQQSYYVPETESDNTPDGVPLAGWWWRVLARVLDGIIAIPLYVITAGPVLATQWGAMGDYVNDTTGNTDPPAAFYLALLVAMVTYFLYEVVFLLWKQATPGKLILGMRVRLRESPDLPAGAVFGRVGITFVMGLCWIASLLDYLWPLWDAKKQALHDKVAKTNVVKPN